MSSVRGNVHVSKLAFFMAKTYQPHLINPSSVLLRS